MIRDSGSIGWFVRLGAMTLFATLAAIACSGSRPANLGDDDMKVAGNLPCKGVDCPNLCATNPNQPGCPCTIEGRHVNCARVETSIGGQKVCGTGFSTCTHGLWADCIITGAKVIPSDVETTVRPQTLGSPVACTNNPCNPGCIQFVDTPDGTTDPDSGMKVSDAGITLVGEGGSSCVAQTCDSLGANCGSPSNRCGSTLNCGTCQLPEVCGSSASNVCGVSGECTNLCLQQVGPTTRDIGGVPTVVWTTLTGKVYAPNGIDPLPNALVYVPNGTPAAFSTSVTCETCDSTSNAAQGFPLVSTTSAIDGSFTLNNVPATDVAPNQAIPLVIQLGHWRRQVSLTSVPKWTTTVVAASLTRLPKNKTEGDIPKFAFSTGQVDAMECIMRKIGVDDSEFTGPSGTGRINFFLGGSSGPGAYVTAMGSGQTPYESELLAEHWLDTGSLNAARTSHVSTLLQTGSVLVAGGSSTPTSGSLSSAEIYDPSLATWTTKASMATARTSATANTLTSGKVLVTGGVTYPSAYLGNAEVYDPTADSWSSAGTIPSLPGTCTGNVVISQIYPGGGVSGSYYRSDFIELHNRGDTAVAIGDWSVQYTAANTTAGTAWNKVNIPSGTSLPAGDYYLIQAYTAGSATALPTANLSWTAMDLNASAGKVALVNTTTALTILGPTASSIVDFVGYGSGVNACESTTSTCAATPAANRAEVRGGAGCNDTNANNADFTQVTVGTSGSNTRARNTSSTSSVCACGVTEGPERRYHSATLLANGKVLVVGGTTDTSAGKWGSYLYDPATNAWSIAARLATGRYAHSATLLNDGRVLVVGGYTAGTTASNAALLYTPSTDSWSNATNHPTAKAEHTATLLGNGKVFTAGGKSGSSVANSTATYDPTTNAWTTGPSLFRARFQHAAVLQANGNVYLAGGATTGSPLANTAVYDATANTVSGNDSGLVTARGSHTMTRLASGQILAVGGSDGASALQSTELSGYAPLISNYDVVLFPCQGIDYAWSSGLTTDAGGGATLVSTDGLHKVMENNLANFANVGGRVFATHYNYAWFYQDPTQTTFSSPLSAAANWNFSLANPSPDPAPGFIDQSFPKGLQLAQWLKQPVIGASAVQGQIDINTLRQDFSTSVASISQNWMSTASCSPMGSDCTSGTCCSGNCVSNRCVPASCTTTGNTCSSHDACCSGLCAAPTCASPQVVISQIYGGGGVSSSSTYRNDFIELHNRSTTSVDIGGWSVQYASAANNSAWTVNTLPSTATIAAGKYYLIRMFTGTGSTSPPNLTSDWTATSQVDVSGTAGKVALVSNATPLSTTLTSAAVSGGAIVDFVGYSSSASAFEGAASTNYAPVPTSTNSQTRGILRLGTGSCNDTNVNSANFSASSTVAARNSSTTASLCSCFQNLCTAQTCSSFGDACTSNAQCCSRTCSNGVCSADATSSPTKKEMHFTFNTPIGVNADLQCGRAVYSDFHVYNASNANVAYPAECPSTTSTTCTSNANCTSSTAPICMGGKCTGMSDQEKLLEFMIFDLSGCIQPDHVGTGFCTPISCIQQSLNCGVADDGCGRALDCGTCVLPETCGGGGDQGVCGVPLQYQDTPFTRDYDGSSVCSAGQQLVWRLFSWATTTPSDTHVDFSIQTSTTKAGLDAALKDPLLFTDPPGPAALVSTVNWPDIATPGAAVAHGVNLPSTGMPSTQLGSASPDSALKAAGRVRNNPFVRVTMHLRTSSDHLSAPTLTSWNMQVDCIDNE